MCACRHAASCVISYAAQSQNTFLYSANSTGSRQQIAIDQQIDEKFGIRNNFIVLVPRGNAEESLRWQRS